MAQLVKGSPIIASWAYYYEYDCEPNYTEIDIYLYKHIVMGQK